MLIRWLFLIFISCSAMAQEQSVNPGINDHYEGAKFEDWVGVFERPGREIFDRRFRILQAMDLQPRMQVADIGAGTGVLSLLMARAVGTEGKVYAVDITPDFVDNIKRRASEQKLDNVVGVVNPPDSSGLPADSVHLVVVAATYHHFEFPKSMLTSIHRALKPRGSLVIIDFVRKPGFSSPWVLGHVRSSEQEVIREIEAAGFKLQENRDDLLQQNYFLRFVRLPLNAN